MKLEIYRDENGVERMRRPPQLGLIVPPLPPPSVRHVFIRRGQAELAIAIVLIVALLVFAFLGVRL